MSGQNQLITTSPPSSFRGHPTIRKVRGLTRGLIVAG